MTLDGLNGPQREAVTYPPSPLLVLAGAGSGKTRVLTHRIAHYIRERGVSPPQVLAITFTNKAAGEMKERVWSLLGAPCRDMWVLTFHSACARILRLEAQCLGYSPSFTIYDQADQTNLVKACLKAQDLSEKEFVPARVLQEIGTRKNELAGPEEALASAEGYWEHRVALVYREYTRRIRDMNAMDFDDLICQAVRLFQENPGVLERYQERFGHVLVDEYQDTNHAQYMVVSLLASRHRSICVVGDDDQSIYGWRGADIRNILEFEKDFPDAHVVTLDQNYRSTQVILDGANAVVSNNSGRKPKALWTSRQGGEPVRFFVANHEEEEARFVADEVEQAFRRGASPEHVAVFYRVHAQSRAVEEGFIRRGIPYRLVGGVRFYERKEVKDALAYLRVLENPLDEISLERIINVPRRGVGDVTWQALVSLARHRGEPIPSLLEDETVVDSCYAGAREGLRQLGRVLGGISQARESMPIPRVLAEVLEGTGYLEALRREGTPEAMSRLENLEELISTAADFEAQNPGAGPGDFLATISLFTDIDSLDEPADAVTLMTLHSAKGLEFPVVFMIGMEEGLFPHQRCIESPEALEEERRLCYVGMTRAMDVLYMVRARSRTVYGEFSPRTPSRFLLEVPTHLVTGMGVAPATPAACRPKMPLSPRQGDYGCGDRVRHAKWGEGTIVSVHGSGEDQEVTIALEGMGLKRVLVKYAPLERV
ncbi:MAG: UvrD-helicase domain-containing protein [Bacillota bacterium]